MNEMLRNPQKLFDVQGKVAIVTGASGAFGRVATETLLGAGCKIVIAGGNEHKLEKIQSELGESGREISMVPLRPNTSEDCKSIVDHAVETYGRVDILVVASGMNDVGKITEMGIDRFENVMSANVNGSWLICKAVGEKMLEQGNGGKIVLVSSARGKLGHPAGYSAYCASKHAVNGITKALGCEWGPHKITVNAIAPTVFRSDLTSWMFADDEPGRSTREGMLARIPVGRLGEPEDLAGPLLFLVSAASDFHTGHTIYADGGYTAG